MKVDFTFTRDGLTINFRNTSREVPAGSTYDWDFGDYNGTTNAINPSYTYAQEGFYLVQFTVTPPAGSDVEPQTVKLSVGVTTRVKTVLSDSIYNLFDTRIPDVMKKFITKEDKAIYIEKWQFYLQPLVPSCVAFDQVNDELAWEALENQLVMEAAAYDWLVVSIISLMQSLGEQIGDDSSGEETGDDSRDVKKIVTGPTTVEWFDGILSGESASSIFKALTGALSPGGIIDILKQNLCMLASRLAVYLPICDEQVNLVTPRKVTTRKSGLLGGPNPSFPVRRSSSGKPKSRG